MFVSQVSGNAHIDIERLEQIKLHRTKFYEILEAENLEGELIDKKGNKRLLSKEGYTQLWMRFKMQNLKR